MATYNRAHFIVETLHSIQNQTYENWECLIIDDGGSDNTSEKIHPFLEGDSRFKYIIRTKVYKKGIPGCRNLGLDLAKGNYVIFFDDDDIVHPQNLELCVNELSDTHFQFCRYNRDVFTGNFDYIFDKENSFDRFEISVKDLDKMIDGRLPFNSCSIMWEIECFKKNKFQVHLMYAEEWELYSRILSNGISGISIDKTLFYGRKHINSNTGEYYNNDPIRVSSKREAIRLIVDNLENKKLLSNYILNYFIKLGINDRDLNLVTFIMNRVSLGQVNRLKIKFRYFLFPFWKIYKNIIN